MKQLTFILLFLLFSITASAQEKFTCGFDDNAISAETKQIMQQIPQLMAQNKLRTKAIDDFYLCRVAVDIDYQTFLKYNGDTLFIKNEAAKIIQKASLIYEKEIATKLVLVNVNIWKEASKDPYNNISSINTMLTNLRNTYLNSLAHINNASDVVMYLNTKGFSGAGGLASGKYNVSPWQNISTIAHEIGHNFGSPHTQSCNWAGGPLDFCYAAEGACYSESLENIKGSLMSYCNIRLNTFHPACITLMNQNATTRYTKIKAITETIKLADNWIFTKDLYAYWTPVLLAENYLMEFATEADFKNIAFRDTVEQAFAEMNYLKKNQNYFLRVKPINRMGQGASWSNTMQIAVPNILETPKLRTPLNKTINVNPTLTLTFDAVEGATSYNVQTSSFNSSTTSFSFDLSITNRNTSTNSITFTTTNEAVAWRVRAVRGTETSAWSDFNVLWTAPNSSIIDLTQQAINGYPNTFPINISGGSNNILAAKLIVSENANFSTPIINRTLKSSIQAGQTNYPYLLENLKPNTTYYVRFEEYNNAAINIIGMPNGLVRFAERSFKTGTEVNPKSFSYFTNSNIENLSRTLRSVQFTDKSAYVRTAEGLVEMSLDGKTSRLIARANSAGIIELVAK